MLARYPYFGQHLDTFPSFSVYLIPLIHMLCYEFSYLLLFIIIALLYIHVVVS